MISIIQDSVNLCFCKDLRSFFVENIAKVETI